MSELTAEQLAEARRLATWSVDAASHELRGTVFALLDEIERLRDRLATMQQTRDQSCSCVIADGSAPLVTHHKDCALRVNLRKRIDPALALSRLATALDSEDETAESIAAWLDSTGDDEIAADIRAGCWRRT